MDSPRITYIPHPDASPESELSVLASVYAYLLQNLTTANRPLNPPSSELVRQRVRCEGRRLRCPRENAIHGAEGDEQIGKEKHGFVHR